MAEDKKGVLVYADWIKKFEALSDDEAGRLIKHFFKYVNDLNPVAPDRITELSFIDIESSLKRDLIKWEKRAERSRENGKSGGRPTILKKPKKTQQVILEPKKPDSVNDNVTVNVNDIDILLKKETKEDFEKINIPKNEQFGKEVLQDQIWVETVLMQNRISPTELEKFIDAFNKNLIQKFDNKISKKEYASHFSSWLPIEIQKIKKDGTKTTPNRNR